MFTVEIKINGALIGHIYGRNRGDQVDGKTRYTYEYYEPERPKLKTGEVWHDPEDGVRPLISLILNSLK